MSNVAMVLRKLDTLRARPSRIVDVLREPRQMVIGGTVANAMGLQIARSLKDRALWHARRSRVTEATRTAYETLERDGVVVIPNFLPEDEFRAVRTEYEASKQDPATRWVGYGENFGSNELLVSDHLERYPATARAFRDSEFLLDLASAISRRRRTFKPHVSFFTVTKPNPDAPHRDLDYNQHPHADRHYAFIKAFFYIDDVSEDDAPFSYARGSHKLSWARARFEYEYSVNYARIRNQRDRGLKRTEAGLLSNDALLRCAEQLMDADRRPCLPIVGKGNTLIVANNQGFHKRGTLRSRGPRATINLDFKYLESGAQLMYPVLKHFYPDP